jgi:hypothetical protein
MCDGRVSGRNALPTKLVDLVSHDLKMCRIHAAWDAAQVIEFFVGWNVTDEKFVRDAVGVDSWSFPEIELTVAVLQTRGPQPARSQLTPVRRRRADDDFRPEANRLWNSHASSASIAVNVVRHAAVFPHCCAPLSYHRATAV